MIGGDRDRKGKEGERNGNESDGKKEREAKGRGGKGNETERKGTERRGEEKRGEEKKGRERKKKRREGIEEETTGRQSVAMALRTGRNPDRETPIVIGCRNSCPPPPACPGTNWS